MSSPVLDIMFDVGSAAMIVTLVDKAIRKCIVMIHRHEFSRRWVSKQLCNTRIEMGCEKYFNGSSIIHISCFKHLDETIKSISLRSSVSNHLMDWIRQLTVKSEGTFQTHILRNTTAMSKVA